MAHRTDYPISTRRAESLLITSKMTGGGAAASLVNAESADFGGGEIVSATYSATGIFNIVFRHKFPQGLVPLSPGIVGTTTGLMGIFTAWDPAAGTATLKLSVGSVATDPATTDSIRFAFIVRNSGKN